MSTDEAAQRLRGDPDNWWQVDVVADVRALLAERDTLHARIRDRDALTNVIDEAIGEPWVSKLAADAVVAYLTSAPEGAPDEGATP